MSSSRFSVKTWAQNPVEGFMFSFKQGPITAKQNQKISLFLKRDISGTAAAELPVGIELLIQENISAISVQSNLEPLEKKTPLIALLGEELARRNATQQV